LRGSSDSHLIISTIIVGINDGVLWFVKDDGGGEREKVRERERERKGKG
jgi:hypothetical protein